MPLQYLHTHRTTILSQVNSKDGTNVTKAPHPEHWQPVRRKCVHCVKCTSAHHWMVHNTGSYLAFLHTNLNSSLAYCRGISALTCREHCAAAVLLRPHVVVCERYLKSLKAISTCCDASSRCIFDEPHCIDFADVARRPEGACWMMLCGLLKGNLQPKGGVAARLSGRFNTT